MRGFSKIFLTGLMLSQIVLFGCFDSKSKDKDDGGGDETNSVIFTVKVGDVSQTMTFTSSNGFQQEPIGEGEEFKFTAEFYKDETSSEPKNKIVIELPSTVAPGKYNASSAGVVFDYYDENKVKYSLITAAADTFTLSVTIWDLESESAAITFSGTLIGEGGAKELSDGKISSSIAASEEGEEGGGGGEE